MAYCKNCGMPIDEKKEIRCSRCGEFIDGIPRRSTKDSNKTIIIVLLCALIVLCVICLVFVFFINKDDTTSVTDITRENTTNVIVQNNVQQAVDVQMTTPEYTKPQITANVNYSQTAYPFTAGSGGYVAFYTPGHAGVNLRRYNDVNSVIIITLPEGTWVTIEETTTVYGDGYVKVSTLVNGKTYTGYILAKYINGVGGLGDDGKGDDEYYDSYGNYDDMSDLYVSYNTPDHLGVNVRTEATSLSDIIVTLPEGTSLAVVDAENSDYSYIEAYYNCNYYRGYILSRYIAS